jgi:hypothetical protein
MKSWKFAVVQGLSAKFRNRLKLAVVGKADKLIARALNVTSYPALRVLPAGNSSQTSEAVHYKGKISFFAIDLFLMDFAKPAASGKSKEGDSAEAKVDTKEQGATPGGKQAEAPKNQKAPSGKASAGGKEQKAAKSAPPEPPVYGGDSPKKNSRDKRGGELWGWACLIAFAPSIQVKSGSDFDVARRITLNTRTIELWMFHFIPLVAHNTSN